MARLTAHGNSSIKSPIRGLRVYHQEDSRFSLPRSIAAFLLARGRYIARQDHDDWALHWRPASRSRWRFSMQIRIRPWRGPVPRYGSATARPAASSIIRRRMMSFASRSCQVNYMVHSSVMMRKAALDEVGGYTTDPSRASRRRTTNWRGHDLPAASVSPICRSG